MSPAQALRLIHRDPACRVLGPGLRAVLWVRGCRRGCPGCLSPESWSPEGPESSLDEVVDWVLACPGVQGLTLSGGEPMDQAPALAALVDRVRARRDLGVVCYTGYRLEEFVEVEHVALLRRVDLLVDGPYRVAEHGDFLWRGSANQRLIALTPRYRLHLPAPSQDRGAGLEFRLLADGRLSFSGVPPWPGYREQFLGDGRR